MRLRNFSTALALAAAPLAPAFGQAAAPQPAAPSNDVTVRAPERMVCRAVTRTSTRMRTARVCRRVSELAEENGGRSQDEMLADAADTLEVLGEKISTNCRGGGPTGGAGPY